MKKEMGEGSRKMRKIKGQIKSRNMVENKEHEHGQGRKSRLKG